jgi:hypothetical protein
MLSHESAVGLREWRFVPPCWQSPLLHLKWYIYPGIAEMGGDSELYAAWREKLKDASPATWALSDKTTYTVPVDYHETDRPFLAVIWGFR